MKFYKTQSIEPVARHLAAVIKREIKSGKRVLWLVPGGSAIAAAIETAKLLEDVPLDNLVVTLTDERYGDVGHPDSNTRQLDQSGFVLSGATIKPVLTGKNLNQTVKAFASTLEQDIKNANYRIGFFGIGPDGHTAGILPDSPAVSSKAWACGYDAGQFTRVTMTPPAIEHLDEVVVYAMGEPKWPVLDSLETNLPLKTQPAQSLKRVPKLTIFNDYKGEGI